MKQKFMLACLLFLSLAVSSFAAGDSFSDINFNIRKNMPSRTMNVPAASQAQSLKNPNAGPAEWTIMVFVNGKNNLEKFALRDINEMEKIGSTQKVNIVVEVGRMDGYDTSDGDWKGVRRYYITKDSDMRKVNSTMLEDLGMIDMGDYNTAIEFGKWAKKKYPAKKYMFVLWNHGSGWIKSVRSYGMMKGISYDDQSHNHIDTPQMAKILKAIGGVNVYGSDACLMQMAEVIYEIKDYAQYVVGSEDVEPGAGWTYNAFLDPLAKNPSMGGDSLAKAVVDAYAGYYEKLGVGYTQSYVNSATADALKILVNALISDIVQANEIEAVRYARDNALKFEYADNKDLYDFVSLLVSKAKSSEVQKQGQILMSYMTKKIVGHNRSKDQKETAWQDARPLSRAKGIAIYFPKVAPSDYYKELKWAENSNWDYLIKWTAEGGKKKQ